MSFRRIKASRFIADVRSRVSDFELMETYGLSFALLERVLDKLVERGALRPEELEERGAYFDNPKNRLRTRREPRKCLKIPLPVEVVGDPSASGIITDMSERGFRTRGLAISAFERKLLAIRFKEKTKLTTVQVEAVCRWTEIDLSRGRFYEAGFEIVNISERDLRVIRQMIAQLGTGDCNIRRPKSGG